MNAYLSWIGAKAGVFIFDSYLMTSLWQGTHKGGLRTVSGVGLEISVYLNICTDVCTNIFQLDLSKHEVAAGAVCDGGHWTLIVSNLKC